MCVCVCVWRGPGVGGGGGAGLGSRCTTRGRTVVCRAGRGRQFQGRPITGNQDTCPRRMIVTSDREEAQFWKSAHPAAAHPENGWKIKNTKIGVHYLARPPCWLYTKPHCTHDRTDPLGWIFREGPKGLITIYCHQTVSHWFVSLSYSKLSILPYWQSSTWRAWTTSYTIWLHNLHCC